MIQAPARAIAQSAELPPRQRTGATAGPAIAR